MTNFFIGESDKRDFLFTLTKKPVNEASTISEFELTKELFVQFERRYSDQITFFDNGDLLIFSGYMLNSSVPELKNRLIKNIQELALIDGHFCGVFFQRNQAPLTFADRFGGRTLYFKHEQNKLICSTKTSVFETNTDSLSSLGLAESLYYRCLSHRQTLFDDITKLPHAHYCKLAIEQDQTFLPFWTMPKSSRYRKISEQQTSLVKSALDSQLQRLASNFKSVAIPLSGGVDSFILAALSRDHFDSVTAYTPYWKNGENPELETAKAFAKMLGIKHVLIEIQDQDIESELCSILAEQEQPLRNYSSIALHILLKSIPEDEQLILYGEAADTLFGSTSTKRILHDNAYRSILSIVPSRIIEIGKKFNQKFKILDEIKKSSVKSLVLSPLALKHSKKSKEVIAHLLESSAEKEDIWSESYLDEEPLSAIFKLNMSTDVAQHCMEIEVAARRFNKVIATPFHCQALQKMSSELTLSALFGSKTNTYLPGFLYSDDALVKPLLRQLACRYAPISLIYQKKHGFPVPMIQWLKGPLTKRLDELFEIDSFLGGYDKSDFDVADNYELLWTLLNIQILVEHQTNTRQVEVN